jgi:hypothetical protein
LQSNHKSLTNEIPHESDRGRELAMGGQTCHPVCESKFDPSEPTIKVMSRLRDVWELSNGEIIIQVHKICSGVERLNESGIDEMDISTTDSVKKTAGSNDSKGLNIITWWYTGTGPNC